MTLANSQAASRDNTNTNNSNNKKKNNNVCTLVLRFAVVVSVFVVRTKINSSSFDSQKPETNDFIGSTTTAIVVVFVVAVAFVVLV